MRCIPRPFSRFPEIREPSPLPTSTNRELPIRLVNPTRPTRPSKPASDSHRPQNDTLVILSMSFRCRKGSDLLLRGCCLRKKGSRGEDQGRVVVNATTSRASWPGPRGLVR